MFLEIRPEFTDSRFTVIPSSYPEQPPDVFYIDRNQKLHLNSEPPMKSSPPKVSKESTNKEFTPEIIKGWPKLKDLDYYVRFANLPNQVGRKVVKKSLDFTLMVVGVSGLRKSTLINSMFLTEIYKSTDYPGPTQKLRKAIAVET